MRNLKILFYSILIISNASIAQIQSLKTHTQMNLDCKKCHICDTPTKANPCLILCPRNKIEVVRHSPAEGPENIIINQIQSDKDIYGPSNFTHRLHSEMSLMSGGCSICHHFNPPGKIVKCSTCHESKRDRTDLSKPDLKAAYHRQCMGCHETWEEESKCENCHQLNSKKAEPVKLIQSEKVHPKVTIPTKIVYDTDYDDGNFVTYFHNDHSSLFGLECSDCHSEESCANCHAKTKPESMSIDLHDKCSSCHDTDDNCESCHKSDVAKPFNHKLKTGFELAGYHGGLACISCHKNDNEFEGLSRECLSCHSTKSGYFDHKITGVLLDETHIEFYCENCHVNNNYNVKPSCDECHDEDIYYPDSVPGTKLK